MKIGLLLIIGTFGFALFQDECGHDVIVNPSSAKDHSQTSTTPTPIAAESPTPQSSPQQIFQRIKEPSLEWYQNFGPGNPDLDCDGIWNSKDNCVFIYNPDQKDSDGDGNGDACDSRLVAPSDVKDHCDEDNDGVPDKKDNCPRVCNPDQKDRNKNRVGDICDDTFPHPVLTPTICKTPTITNVPLPKKVSSKTKN